MEIETKFSPNDVVYFMKDNKIEKGIIATVDVRILCGSKKNEEDEPIFTIKETYGLFTGLAAPNYTNKEPHVLFRSKENLIEALKVD